jgi:hypothetical protein
MEINKKILKINLKQNKIVLLNLFIHFLSLIRFFN